MRLLCTSVLAVLLLAPLAHAEVDPLAGQDLEELGAGGPGAPELPPAQAPPLPPTQGGSDPTAPPSPPDVEPVDPRQAAIEAWRAGVAAARQAAAEAQRLAGEKLQEADDALQPGHTLVRGTQGQVDGLLGPSQAMPEEAAPEPEPATQASVANAWPEYAQPVMILTGAFAGFGILAWLLGQSATVGAGAAGSAALRDGRRFLPFASPLFTRFERDTVLGHPKREAIYGQIIGKPGITLQDLCQESGLSRTAVTHHLRLLEQQHLVVSKRVGRSRHFFENGGRYGRHQKDAYAVLHNDRSKDIHTFIQSNPGTIQKDLCGAFGIQASVAHWHVKRLLESNLVEAVRQGRTVSYFPAGDAPQPSYA